MAREEELARRPALEVLKYSWSKGGFDTIGMFEVTFRNNTNGPIGNIQYSTVYKAETGEIVTRGGHGQFFDKDKIRKVIPAYSTRTLEINDGFISSEAVTASFEVNDFDKL